jgi:hypothetical protein
VSHVADAEWVVNCLYWRGCFFLLYGGMVNGNLLRVQSSWCVAYRCFLDDGGLGLLWDIFRYLIA